MKIGEIWIMKKRILKEYNKSYQEYLGEAAPTQGDTKVEIVNIDDDKVWFIYKGSAQFSDLDREDFVEDYEKVYEQ